MTRSVVITGVGVVSPAGTGRLQFWEGLSRGSSFFRPVTLFDTSRFQVHVAGEITEFDPLPFLGKKGLRDLDRSTRLACTAARIALDDSGLRITDSNSDSVGVSLGATFGSLHSISQFDRSGVLEGPRAVNPSHFPNTVINSPASQVSIRFGIKGFNSTISTGFCASLDAVGYAADFLALNRVDAVLAGGVEELCEETFRCFHALGYLSGSDGGEPRCCPFDARRNGTILSEGAAALVLEREDRAAERGAGVLARVLGWGNAFDPLSDSSYTRAGQGLADAVQIALKSASLRSEDIDCIYSCANSTGLDLMETRVMKRAFGNHAKDIPITAIKSIIGESYSASGAMAVAAGVGAFQGLIPPIVNHAAHDPACDLNYVLNTVRQARVRNVLVTAADPFGQNTAVVLGRYA